MFDSPRTPTFILLMTAFVVLPVSHGWLAFTGFSFSAGIISFAGVTASDLLFPVASIALLGAALIFHTIYVWPDLSESFGNGYRSNPGVIELVRSEVVIASQDPNRPSPYGGLRASIFPSVQKLGRFPRPDGTESYETFVLLAGTVHWSAVVSGICRMFRPRHCLWDFTPMALGIWALASVTTVAVGLSGTCVTSP